MSFGNVKVIIIIFQSLLAVEGSRDRVAGSFNKNIIYTGCDRDADCKEFIMNQVTNSTCLNQQCVCRDSDFKTIECLPEKQGFTNVIGGKCPCNIQWSSCVDGFCMCKSDFTSSADERHCIPRKVPIGSRCENDAQCSKETVYAACINQMCSCQSRFILHNGACQGVLKANECANGTECATIIPNTICASQQCHCESGYVAAFDQTTCLPNVGYNDDCLDGVQCLHKLGEGATCENGKCICPDGFSKISFNVANETKTICENRIAVGQMCAYDTDCLQSHFNGTEQSMHCVLRECQCTSDYELDQSQRFCIKSKNTELQSTWFDSIFSKFSSSFANSLGNQNNYFIKYWILILCFTLFF